jgi:hypothetical protein
VTHPLFHKSLNRGRKQAGEHRNAGEREVRFVEIFNTVAVRRAPSVDV